MDERKNAYSDDDLFEDERIEDTTLYGERVSSYFKWITPDRQRKKARKMENITKKK